MKKIVNEKERLYEKMINEIEKNNYNNIDLNKQIINLKNIEDNLNKELINKNIEIEKWQMKYDYSNKIQEKDIKLLNITKEYERISNQYRELDTSAVSSHMIKYKCLVYNNLFIVLYDELEVKKKNRFIF